MKDDASQEKKSQKKREQETSDVNLPPYEDLQKTEEDVDFEILDALEQMEQTESGYEGGPSDEAQTVELTLDDEDMIFGEGAAEEEGGFGFDEGVIGGGEEMGEELQIGAEEESFSLDLDQEGIQDELDLALDQETAFQLEEDTGEYSTPEMPLVSEEEFDIGLSEPGTDLEFEEFNLDAEKNDFSSGLEEEEEEEGDMISQTTQTDEGFGDFSLDLGTDEESFDLGTEDEEAGFDQLVPDVEAEETEFAVDTDMETSEETSEDFTGEDIDSLLSKMASGEEDTGIDLDLEEEGIDTELPEMDVEGDIDEFQGKPVISVGEDQVIDLGDETTLEQEDTSETDLDSWEQEETEMPEMPGEGFEEEETELQTEQEEEEEEDFMASIEDMDINLEEEATKALEELGSFAGDSLADQETSDIDLEGEIDLTVDEDWEPEEAEEAGFPEETEEQGVSDTYQERPEEQEAEQDLASLAITAEKEISEEAETPVETEVDEREFLELSLRLSDAEMQEFESMVAEAKTLQSYLDGLETHKPEIKGGIFQKLQEEYVARKTAIFSTPEFTSMHTNVEYDLQDMLAKRDEFVATVESLKDELEEITVRHLVGEYTDDMLSEKEETQKAQIEHWNEKTEKIEVFINRYQESLAAEQELNPLRQEPELEEEIHEEPEQQPTPEPEVTPEPEQISEPEEALEQEPTLQPEEPLAQEPVIETEEESIEEEERLEEEVVPSIEEGVQEETELEEPEEVSFGIETEEDIEITEASEELDEFDDIEGLEDSEFSLDTEFDEEEFEFDDSAEMVEGEEDEFSLSYEVETVDEEETAEEEDMISCKKCGRQTPGSEKFCVHCGAKAQ